MNENLSPLSAFVLTGERAGGDLYDIGGLNLRPALFSAYRDLSALRYDYPLVLVDGADDGAFVRSLSDIIDGVLREIAPRGIEGERPRKNVLALEREIRALAARGLTGTPLQLWDLAETNLLSEAADAERKSLSECLSPARAALRVDGEVIDCGEETPTRVVTHAWTVVRESKGRAFRGIVSELVLKLSDILKADALRSEEARDAEALKRSVGSGHEATFDFEAMSEILNTAFTDGTMPEARRQRIRHVLSVLESQRFFATADREAGKAQGKSAHDFVFDCCSSALDAFRKRLPEMVEIVKAMTIARLELENRYEEARHDPFFDHFDERFLEPDDLALFPTYLVHLRHRPDTRQELADIIEVLSSGLPIKVLAQTDDLLGDPPCASGEFGFGSGGSRLATMALGLDSAFVLQSGGSGLYRLRQAVLRGMANGGPALFNLFSGVSGNSSGSIKNRSDLSSYLRAAAATESRAFPAFVFDPAAGDDWASRFSIDFNPQLEAEWPVHRFDFKDDDLQRVSDDLAFTFVDFVASDERYHGRFAGVPRSGWDDRMVPVSEFLDLDPETAVQKVPFILMVDDDNALHKVVAENRLIQAARRCRQVWKSLRELGGIDNSHVNRRLALEREAWEQEKKGEIEQPTRRHEAEAEPPAPDSSAREEETTTAVQPATEAPPEGPYIETPRCTTCNECTEINGKMFVYDDDMQAYIADPDAGTFRQLVEAAEACQVAIIHPGKPRNPNEPGLNDLIARAAAFA